MKLRTDAKEHPSRERDFWLPACFAAGLNIGVNGTVKGVHQLLRGIPGKADAVDNALNPTIESHILGVELNAGCIALIFHIFHNQPFLFVSLRNNAQVKEILTQILDKALVHRRLSPF